MYEVVMLAGQTVRVVPDPSNGHEFRCCALCCFDKLRCPSQEEEEEQAGLKSCIEGEHIYELCNP